MQSTIDYVFMFIFVIPWPYCAPISIDLVLQIFFQVI